VLAHRARVRPASTSRRITRHAPAHPHGAHEHRESMVARRVNIRARRKQRIRPLKPIIGQREPSSRGSSHTLTIRQRKARREQRPQHRLATCIPHGRSFRPVANKRIRAGPQQQPHTLDAPTFRSSVERNLMRPRRRRVQIPSPVSPGFALVRPRPSRVRLQALALKREHAPMVRRGPLGVPLAVRRPSPRQQQPQTPRIPLLRGVRDNSRGALAGPRQWNFLRQAGTSTAPHPRPAVVPAQPSAREGSRRARVRRSLRIRTKRHQQPQGVNTRAIA
jgi:hypothetical protein